MLNERLREIRTARKISQVELARLLGVTKQCVSNWENDNIQPSIEMLTKISDELNVSTDYLLSRDQKRYLDVTGLSEDSIQHLQLIIDDIKKTAKP
ncbi:MAG: helix-turn-helix transcriptional regulator [Ruminococcaceae bacterium]|nr:helix-turn-helix transcriptional regulator [Oscillospiraceae bacterium]MEE1074715.1 helix-turn-helix transcriptional regulator [Acutalibacteraceae bacterium]